MNCYIPDYPRPQLVRGTWESLNGQWDFAFDDAKNGLANGWQKGLANGLKITVPYSYETKLSGIGDETPHERVWYSRSVNVNPEKLGNGGLMLHFEGCDYRTTVWVNGIRVGEHTGGYARFSFDITEAVSAGENTVAVLAEDPMDNQHPRGKQRWVGYNHECWYVQTTGIWKTVWMEYVPEAHISALKLTPNLSKSELLLECDVTSGHYGKQLQLEATITYQGTFINRVTIPVTAKHLSASINVYDSASFEWAVHAWRPESPALYDLELRLVEDGNCGDLVRSYFGMREIRIDGNQVLLNGSPLYQRLILDQGYWKDSGLTPPNEAALIEDIAKIMQLGYNGLRKHQKTEDERFLYWCDVKGLLVWSEMAAAYRFNDYAVDTFMAQWSEIVRQNYSHPCIITWTPVNESWGVNKIRTDRDQQHFTEAIYHLTKSLDANRPVIVNDGWEHTVSDIITLHDYEEEGSVFLDRYINHKDEILSGELCHNLSNYAFAQGYSYHGQPVIISEYGGIAYNNGSGWGYGNKVETEDQFLARFENITAAIRELPYCCGFCYTQVTDVQQEINGLMDIERNFKVNPEKIRNINLQQESCCHR